MDRPLSTSLMLVSAMSVESVVAAIMRVLQSYKHLKLEHGVTVEAIIIRIDVGAGSGRKVLNIDTDRLAKQTDCVPGQTKRCNDCDRLCQSEECFQTHKEATGRQKFSLCDKMYQCRKCSKVISHRYCPKESHHCRTTKCPSCKAYVVGPDHYCLLQTFAPKAHSDRQIFFDFETDQSSGIHEVNFAVAQYFNGDETIFKAYDSLKDFCFWLFSPVHKNFTVIAHNMKGFDGQFIMAWMLEQGVAPGVIPNRWPSCTLLSISRSSTPLIFYECSYFPQTLAKINEMLFKRCFFHGCQDCFDGDVLNPLFGLPMNALFEKTKATSAKLPKAGYILDEKWEHEFRREIELVADLQKFV
ncbi:hypothetical protein AVEN_235008-1 [Araneus ventricosus]|uniref:DNA-directed DNA polymerase n=1 Tax=Araneus ventricosus TaxID=182803 RepID=A0A4Y2FP83_ARAVE|nr:hypothetical protein AVEN_235008-1 [Araneus ventricosus]